MPVHRVVGVLQQVRARLFVQSIAHRHTSVSEASSLHSAMRRAPTNRVVLSSGIREVRSLVTYPTIPNSFLSHFFARSAPGPLVRDHVPRGCSCSSGPAAACEATLEQDQTPAMSTTSCSTSRSARSSAAASAACWSTAPGAARGSAHHFHSVEGRDVVPRRVRRRAHCDVALQSVKQPSSSTSRIPSRRGRRAASSRAASQRYQRRALGQGDEPRRALGRHRRRRGAAPEPALRGIPRRPGAVFRALVL